MNVWLIEIKNDKIVTNMLRNMFNRCQETWPIRMNMFRCSYNFLKNVDKNMKLWTKTWNSGQKFRVYLWTFKWTQKCSYNFLENMDKNMKLWTKKWNCGQKFWVYLWIFKWTQKCSYNFLENVDKNMKLWTNISSLLMNIH